MSRVQSNERTRDPRALRAASWGAAALLATALFAVGGAHAGIGTLKPGIKLGTITIDNNTAVVQGAVDDLVPGARLVVNGKAVVLDDNGAFTTVVDLDATTLLELALAGVGDERVLVHVPVRVALAKGGKGLLDGLHLAGVSVDVPQGGFAVLDGRMPEVSGTVLGPEHLAKLTVNGRDVLSLVGPGGRFVVEQPPAAGGGTETIVVRATDREGVSQTTVFQTTRLTTAIRTRVGTSVAAAAARGIRIAALRFDASRVAARRLGVVLTVRDRRGYLVRGAAIRLTAMPGRHIVNGPTRVGFTNRVGQVRFTYVLRRAALRGKTRKTFTALARASTPFSRTSAWASRKLPLARAG